MTKRAISLRYRIRTVIITVVITLFLLEFLIALLWFSSRYTEQTNNEIDLSRALGLTFRSLVRDISRTEDVVGIAYQNTPFTDGEVDRYFHVINGVYPVVQNFVIADSTGTILTGSNTELIGVSLSDRDYFRRLKDDSVVVSNYLHLKPDSSPGFAIARAFYTKSGAFKFAVIAGVLAEKMGEVTLSLKRRPGEFVTLFDNDGTLIYTNQNLDTLTDSIRFLWKHEDKLLQQAMQGETVSGFFRVPVKNYSERIGARVPIGVINWVAGSAIIRRIFFEPVVLSFLAILIAMVIVSGITFIFAERTTQTINNSLRSVQLHVKNIAQGKYSTMQESSGFIEFDNLTKDANNMAGQLKDREERLKLLAAVVENSNDFIILASPGMVPFYINAAGSHMVGINRDSLKKTHLIDYFPEEDRELLEKETIPSLYREERWVGEVQLRNFKTGQLIPTIWNAFAIKDENGAIITWASISPDLTNLKKTTEALKNSESRLKELNQNLETIIQNRTEQVHILSKALILAEQRERKRFSYILHENLQQLILGSSILLKQHLHDHQNTQQGEFDDVSESIKLLENALQTTKILSIELNPPILTSQGLDAALEWLNTHMSQNYNLIVDLKINGPVNTIKNETQLMLTQMVRELLNNVVQHAGVQHASVDASLREKTVKISICDKGRGFDHQKEMDKKINGTHLGLFSIRERLKLFGGDLIIESTSGKGTCTTIVLPLENT